MLLHATCYLIEAREHGAVSSGVKHIAQRVTGEHLDAAAARSLNNLNACEPMIAKCVMRVR